MQQAMRLHPNPGRVSTFLVGRHHFLALELRVIHFGSLNSYLEFLLRTRKRGFLGQIPAHDRTQYQPDGLDLRPLKFRPSNNAWLTLGLLARQFGVSRCAMFMILFLMDLEDRRKQVVVATMERARTIVEYRETLDRTRLIWRRHLREKPG